MKNYRIFLFGEKYAFFFGKIWVYSRKKRLDYKKYLILYQNHPNLFSGIGFVAILNKSFDIFEQSFVHIK
ncbi:MAG: hypothetical protein EGP82_02310 [Odoribacter splanchnicus]|nr:hypothetical protein [Odoribacter splanchnicus]